MADLVMRQSSMRSTGVPLGGGTAKPTFLSGTEKWHKISRMRRSCEHGGTGGNSLTTKFPKPGRVGPFTTAASTRGVSPVREPTG